MLVDESGCERHVKSGKTDVTAAKTREGEDARHAWVTAGCLVFYSPREQRVLWCVLLWPALSLLYYDGMSVDAIYGLEHMC